MDELSHNVPGYNSNIIAIVPDCALVVSIPFSLCAVRSMNAQLPVQLSPDDRSSLEDEKVVTETAVEYASCSTYLEVRS